MQQLIPTFTGQLAGETQPLVNARDLHSVLGVGKDFSNWLKARIEQYEFIEGEDYSPNLASGENQGLSRFVPGHNRKDYALTMDMAKELCLVENTPQGKQARRYFIEVEKQARLHATQEIPAFLRKGYNGLASPAEHQIAVMRSVVLEAKPQWAKLKKCFEADLTQNDMQKLTGLSTSTVRQYLRHMALCGLIDYETNPLLSMAGAKGNAKMLSMKGGV